MASSEISTREVYSPDYAPKNAYFVLKQSIAIHSFIFLSGFALGALGMQSYLLKNSASLNGISNSSTGKLRRPEL